MEGHGHGQRGPGPPETGKQEGSSRRPSGTSNLRPLASRAVTDSISVVLRLLLTAAPGHLHRRIQGLG